MKIRTKLMVAFAVAVVILGGNIGIVSVTIRQMQEAVEVVTMAVEGREANYAAGEVVQAVRKGVMRLAEAEAPQSILGSVHVQTEELGELLQVVDERATALNLNAEMLLAVKASRESFVREWQDLEAAIKAKDGEGIHEHSMFVDDALGGLSETLSVLNVELRAALEQGVADEHAVHNTPIRAGFFVGGTGSLFLLSFAWVFTGRFTRRIHAIRERLMDIAQGEGDLVTRITNVKGRDEIRDLADSFNTFADRLRTTILHIRDMADDVSRSVKAIAVTNEEMSRSMAEQADQGGQIARAMDEFASSVQDVAAKASEVAMSADEAGTVAEAGGRLVGEVRAGMQAVTTVVRTGADSVSDLNHLAENIGRVIVFINDIADQTNLLALNAAIEAARAGEHGRGFAVVAEEVRQLATRTTKATDEVGQSIRRIQEGVKCAVEQMELGTKQVGEATDMATEAETGLHTIVSTVRQVVSMIGHIAAAAEQQGATGVEVKRRVTDIASMIMQADESASHASNSVSQLSTKVQELDQVIAQFRLE